MAEAFGVQPSASISQALGDWQATKAAEACFANPTILSSDILLPPRSPRCYAWFTASAPAVDPALSPRKSRQTALCEAEVIITAVEG